VKTRAASSNVRSETTLGFNSIAALAAFCLLALIMSIAPWHLSLFWPVNDDYYDYLPQALFAGVMAFVCVLLALASRSENGAAVRPWKGIAWCLAAFVSWVALSCIGAIYRHDALLETARVVSVVLGFFAVRAVLKSTVEFDRTRVLLLGAIVLGAVAVASGPALGFIQTRSPQLSPLFTHNNLFANYCAMALPLCLGTTMLARRMARRGSQKLVVACGLAAAAWIALGLLASASKGGFLAALCGAVAFGSIVLRARFGVVRAWLRANRTIAIVLGLVLVGGVGLVGGRTVLPRILAARGSQNHSTMFRIYTWRAAAEMTQARPVVGFGPGSFPWAHSKFSEVGFTRTAHQSWLQIAGESGVPALLLLLGATVLSLRRGWRVVKTENGAQWPIVAGAVGAIVAFAVHGMLDAGWGIISVALLLMVSLALLDSCEEVPTSTVENEASSQRAAALWLGAALLLGGASWLAQRAVAGEDARREGREAAARGDATTALERAQAATIADPLGVRIWTNRAQTEESLQTDGTASWQRALVVNPWGAQAWRQWAQSRVQRGEDPSEQFARSLEVAPNDTETLRERAEWRIARGDARGWDDWQKIAQLLRKPYGLYPATPELVNYDFAHALLTLAARDTKREQNATAKEKLQEAQRFLAASRAYQTSNPGLLEAARGAAAAAEAKQELEGLEARAKELAGKLQ
jgi:O-antigen ligase